MSGDQISDRKVGTGSLPGTTTPRRGPGRLRVCLCTCIMALAGTVVRAGVLGPGDFTYLGMGSGQGLAGDSVTAIIQDRRGYIWIGAAGGVSRFDGHGFRTFRPRFEGTSFASSYVTALAEAPDGDIWIGTEGGGISRLDPETGTVSSFPGGTDPAQDRVTAMTIDAEGSPVVGSAEGGLERYNHRTGRFEPFGPGTSGGSRVNRLLRDASGRIWAATDAHGLALYEHDGSELARYRKIPGDPASLASDGTTALFEDSQGSIWVGTADGNVALHRSGRFLAADRPATSPGRVESIAEDRTGRLWIAYRDSGIVLLDPATLRHGRPAGRGDHPATTLVLDRGGLVWAGTPGEGIRVYNPGSAMFRRIRFPDLRDGLPVPRPDSALPVRALARLADGRVAALAADGSIRHPDPDAPMDAGEVRLNGDAVRRGAAGSLSGSNLSGPLLASRDGGLWTGETGGIVRLAPGGGIRRYRVTTGAGADPDSFALLALEEASDGAIWAGFERAGLYRLDPESGSVERHDLSETTAGGGLPPTVTSVLMDGSGRIWAGTREAGLFRRDPDSPGFVPHRGAPGEPSPVGDTHVTTIFEDRSGTIWIGTGGAGLAGLDGESGVFVHYGPAEGFHGDSVLAIAEDRTGLLWIASSGGLYSHDRRIGDFFRIGAEDGLLPGSFSPDSLLADDDGRIWVGGSGGLTVFNPATVPRYLPQPEIRVTGTAFQTPGRSPSAREGNELTLGYDNRGLAFDIAVIDYTAPAGNRYAMKLEGRQEEWTFLGGTNTGFIAPLAPGRYTLRVKGSNGNGIWNNYGAVLSILVVPPFWSTAWFRAGALLVAGAGLAFALRARLHALRRRNELLVNFSRHVEHAREEERKLAAREVHDEIGQHLTVLNLHAFWLASRVDANRPDLRSRIDEMRRNIGDAMDSVKSVATKLRPAVLDTLDFAGAMRWYAGNFERLSGIDVLLSTEESIIIPSGELATALFRILQEMLGNVMRHSGATSVRVGLSSSAGEYLLEAADDGKGMDPGAATRDDSFGIIGMRERCAAFGGRLEIESRPGAGTTIRARIPVPPASAAGARKDPGGRTGRRFGTPPEPVAAQVRHRRTPDPEGRDP